MFHRSVSSILGCLDPDRPTGVAYGVDRRAFGRLGAGVFLLLAVTLYAVVTRYMGLSHDAMVYALQAVARLAPDPLAGDVFLGLGSQDRFSAFSRLVAPVIGELGVDAGAAVLTLASLCAWFMAAGALARRLQDDSLALLSVALLLVLPGWYGAKEVFRYAEPFMTARSVAEALSLAALLATVCDRRWLAGILLAIALSVHPLMAFPAALVACLYLLPIRGLLGWGAALIAVVAAAVMGAVMIGLPAPLMSGDWLEVTRWRASFLFTDTWSPRDWAVASLTLLTLSMGVMLIPPGAARRVSQAALCVGLAGVAAALISSELAPLKILLQGQPWRWLWIGRVLATALLPLILLAAWRAGSGGRSAALLLGCAWLLSGAGSYQDVPPIGTSGLLALLATSVWIARSRLSPSALRTVYRMAVSVAMLVMVVFGSIVVVAAGNNFSFGRDPFWIQRLQDVIAIPGISAGIVAAAWFGVVARPRPVAIGVLLVAVACVLAAAGPEIHRRWTLSPYDEANRARFAHWRELIPPGSEVLWPRVPQATWFLLDRRNYLSVSQATGVVFSEATAAELRYRAEVVSPWIDAGWWFRAPGSAGEVFRPISASVLTKVCTDPRLGFIVSNEKTDSPAASAEWPGPGDTIYLYRCADFQQGAAGA